MAVRQYQCVCKRSISVVLTSSACWERGECRGEKREKKREEGREKEKYEGERRVRIREDVVRVR